MCKYWVVGTCAWTIIYATLSVHLSPLTAVALTSAVVGLATLTVLVDEMVNVTLQRMLNNDNKS